MASASIEGNLGMSQSYMLEPQSDPHLYQESAVQRDQEVAGLSEW